MNDETKSHGKGWKKGQSGNPLGRPTRKREQQYLEIFKEELPFEKWRLIVKYAVADAITDQNTAQERAAARKWLGEYAIGKPQQTVRHVEITEGWGSEWDGFTDEELKAIAESGAENIGSEATSESGVGEA